MSRINSFGQETDGAGRPIVRATPCDPVKDITFHERHGKLERPIDIPAIIAKALQPLIERIEQLENKGLPKNIRYKVPGGGE